jgi:Rieske Fe-S protein
VGARCSDCYVVDARYKLTIESRQLEKERRNEVEPVDGDDKPHLPPPSLWPVGFAVGIACVLVGLIVSPLVIAPIGGLITLIFGFLWVRDATTEYRTTAAPVEPERREPAAPPIPANEGEAAMPLMDDEEIETYPRSKFLEAATLGVGGLISGLVAVPALGFMVAPAFVGQEAGDVDLGPIDAFKENQWMIATFLRDPHEGEVSRRTAYVRNNGQLEDKPSFTILSNRCAHLGCPVQPNGPVFDDQTQVVKPNPQPGNPAEPAKLIPMLPGGGFGCPCHGGQYDQEGNRTAGPPVRALDRYTFSVIDGRLILGSTFSVASVDGTGKDAKIHKYELSGPGQHITGPEAWLYPIQPPS